MSFMEPYIVGPMKVGEFVDDFEETLFLEEEDISDPTITEGFSLVEIHENKFIAYLSAPGYMDRTDNSMHDTEEEAREYLATYYNLCEKCLDELIEDFKCPNCDEKGE